MKLKFISIAIFTASLLVVSAFAQSRALLNRAQTVTGDAFAISVKTPKGANIYAVSKPSAAMLKAIDKGLTDLFAIARKNNYRSRLNYSDYSIFIAKSDRTKDSQGN